MRSMRLYVFLLFAISALISAGCEDNLRLPGDPGSPMVTADAEERKAEQEKDQKEVQKLIKQLAAAKNLQDPDLAKNAEAGRDFDEAVQKLTVRGSRIEPQLLAALSTSDDWGVRYGLIQVLDSIGTRTCVQALINVLDDPQPEVTRSAMSALHVITEIKAPTAAPAPGDPPPVPASPWPGTGDIPALPASDTGDSADMAAFASWHSANKVAFKAAFDAWWKANQNLVAIH